LAKRKEQSSHKPKKEGEEEEGKEEAYHGQVTQKKDILDGGEEGEDDEGWFVGGLKFRRHVDDAFRGGDGREVDGYVTVVPGRGGGREGGREGREWRREEGIIGNKRK